MANRHWIWSAYIGLGSTGTMTSEQVIAKLQADYPAQPVAEIIRAMGNVTLMATPPPPAHATVAGNDSAKGITPESPETPGFINQQSLGDQTATPEALARMRTKMEQAQRDMAALLGDSAPTTQQNPQPDGKEPDFLRAAIGRANRGKTLTVSQEAIMGQKEREGEPPVDFIREAMGRRG